MKQIQKLFKLFTIVMAVAALGSIEAYAGGSSSNYYSKVTAKAIGSGSVYVKYNTAATEPAYAVEVSAQSGTDSKKSVPTHTYYLYVQPEDGCVFKGWFKDEALTEPATDVVEKNGTYTIGITGVKDDSSYESAVTLFAKFVEAGAAVLSYDELHKQTEKGGTVNNETLTTENVTEAITYSSSNEAVATVAADGTVTGVGAGSAYIIASANGASAQYIVTVTDYSEAGKTQIGNGDFEDWSSVADNNHAPKNWNSFETAEGSYANMAGGLQVQMVQENRPGSNGLFCADIFAKDVTVPVIGRVATAQGNLTLGCINAGATSANDAQNHNFSKVSDENKSETISKIPTALKCWVKFVPAKANANYPYARVAASVHDKFNYITHGSASHDTDSNKEHVVASAEQNFAACDWTELTIPFTMTGNAVLNDQLYIVVNFTTNATPGQGQVDDHLFIDDVELVYDTDYDKVPVTVSDAKYATFVAPFDVKMPAAITASTVETVGEEYDTMLDLTAVENNLVPANTPVILSSKDAQDRIAYGVAAPATAEAGLLIGVYEDTEAPVDSYVLQSHEGVVGMYQVEAGTQPTVGAGRAYLNVPAGSDIKAFFFDSENATAISSIQQEKQNDAIYNLAGQRTNRMQKGINIVNGKKIAVK